MRYGTSALAHISPTAGRFLQQHVFKRLGGQFTKDLATRQNLRTFSGKIKFDKLFRSKVGVNPFRHRSFKEIDQMLRLKGFKSKGPDPINGKGSYFHPITGRRYYLDYGNRIYRNNIREQPHIDAYYFRMVKGAEKRRWSLKDTLYEKE